jgi:hypothetical protein
MGHQKKTKRRERLGRVAAGLAIAAAAIVPGAATALAAPVPPGIEAELRTTPPTRLLALASSHPEQVLSNRALRQLRAQDPDAHREILLAARFGRAEIALANAIARTDPAVLRVFACDCAARVAPLYERFGGGAGLLEAARARAAAAAAATTAGPAKAAAAPGTASAFDLALARFEADVDALEREVTNEASVARGATSALRHLVLSGSEPTGSPDQAPFHMLAVAMTAAQAIDEALLVAAGGSLSRLGAMCEAIAEAVYLDHAFRSGEPTAALDAVFREIAWQRAHLRALRSRA